MGVPGIRRLGIFVVKKMKVRVGVNKMGILVAENQMEVVVGENKKDLGIKKREVSLEVDRMEILVGGNRMKVGVGKKMEIKMKLALEAVLLMAGARPQQSPVIQSAL